MSGKIFLSYRRDDTRWATLNLFNLLAQTFPRERLFMDVEGYIEPGDDFVEVLEEQVSACEVMVVVVGPQWLALKGKDGRPRIHDSRDFVHIEIAAALRRRIRVIPALVDGARMPDESELPEALKGLTRRQTIRLSHERFAADGGGLVKTLQEVLGEVPAAAPAALPAWARDAGLDSFGLWAEFALGDVQQRMRWIEPGRFLMGSPEKEPGRLWDEGPRHEVRLSKGFWLFDTPATQELWTAAMGDNPSRFKHPKCPVEQVSWEDAGRFLQRVNSQIPGLDLVLPTEAQWEYACRAGTVTPNYAGSKKDLADIAWFSKNTGYGTEPVAAKRCNAWGLYDMLGNVWEWCADGRRTYTVESVTDPAGSLGGASGALKGDIVKAFAVLIEATYPQALRGGSWFNPARDVRAARRYAVDRESRYGFVGFRCARVRQ